MWCLIEANLKMNVFLDHAKKLETPQRQGEHVTCINRWFDFSVLPVCTCCFSVISSIHVFLHLPPSRRCDVCCFILLELEPTPDTLQKTERSPVLHLLHMETRTSHFTPTNRWVREYSREFPLTQNMESAWDGTQTHNPQPWRHRDTITPSPSVD